jgi:hypothetical protein
MTTSKIFSRSTRLALLAGVAILIAAPGAVAKGSGSQSHTGSSSGFKNTIHPIIVNKPVYKKPGKHHGDTHEASEPKGEPKRKPIVEEVVQPSRQAPAKPGQQGMLPPHDPVGNTHPTVGGGSVVKISNGVSTASIATGAGLTVASHAPGTITISNGTNSVTLPGGSVVVSGVGSVASGGGVQIVRHPNGDIAVAAAAPPAAPAPAPAAPPLRGGLTGTGPIDEIKGIAGQAADVGRQLGQIPGGIKDAGIQAGKDIGNGLVDLGKGFISIGGPSAPPKTSTSTQQ